jgi:predicted Rossmann fold nucleotide-binding protein DprA/Smf involved in DNA uptake
MPRAMRSEFAWEGTGMPQARRRTLTGAERADWLRLSRTRAIGPITFFHLLDRYGAAADVLADLPTLAKKAGDEVEIKAPSVDEIKRNRVISGPSLGTIVVEAAERSGSLITARFALEQRREVMAVPGSPLDPRCKGPNRLLKQGAALIESAEDVLQAMQGISAPSFDEPFADRFSPRDADVPPSRLRAVREALSPTPVRVDEIVRAVDAPRRLVLAALADLELAGEALTHVGGTASRAV